MRNPYSPGAGSRPPVLTGRDDQLETFRILLQRLRLGRPEKSMIITGLRGVGKTVLLNTFENIAEEAEFRTAKTEITHETDFKPMIARMVRRALLSLSPMERFKERALRAAGILKAFTLRLPDGVEIGLDVEAVRGQADIRVVWVRISQIFWWRSVTPPRNKKPGSPFSSMKFSS
ncbi:MAG: ATP-binding protein [Actinomycetota bacterium]